MLRVAVSKRFLPKIRRKSVAPRRSLCPGSRAPIASQRHPRRQPTAKTSLVEPETIKSMGSHGEERLSYVFAKQYDIPELLEVESLFSFSDKPFFLIVLFLAAPTFGTVSAACQAGLERTTRRETRRGGVRRYKMCVTESYGCPATCFSVTYGKS